MAFGTSDTNNDGISVTDSDVLDFGKSRHLQPSHVSTLSPSNEDMPLHPMHHRGRTMRGKYVGTYTIPRPVEKLLKRMIVADAVPGKLVRKKSASAARKTPPLQKTPYQEMRLFRGVLTFRSLVSNSRSPSHSSVSRSVSRTPEKEIQEDTRVNERHHTRSKSEDACMAPAECNLPSGMRRSNKGIRMYKSSTLGQISSGCTTPVWCASPEPIKFEQRRSGEAGRFSYEDIRPENFAEKD
ncbi:hypothetical protein C8R48DRAFT_774521 [Suillus tomentosus]|nr:hypothetical protein C8R48DRAFT_774521 [Suillus tomentosus]